MNLKRHIVALIMLPLFYLFIMKLQPAFFFLLLLIVSVVAQSEFYSIYRVDGIMRFTGLILGISIILAMTHFSRNLFPDILAFSFIVLSAMRLIEKRDPSFSLRDIGPVLLAILYIPCLLVFQIFLRNDGPEWIVFLYGCVWASDSLAYYVGKAIGKRRLYEEVSPNKTVAGAFGSLTGGALAGVILKWGLIPSMSIQKSLVIGLSIGIATVIGDLVESMFKRDAGVKDSSTLVPGHGGVLDKVDGALFSGPVLYWITRHAG
jgi:phosphatidate cytidylyltransferase